MSMYAGGMGGNIAVLHLGDNILVSVPPDPDDDTVAQLQAVMWRAGKPAAPERTPLASRLPPARS